jgi:membrane fusion protein
MQGLREQLAQAEQQIVLQRSRVASAERTIERTEALVQSQFLSAAALQQKQDELMDQRSQLAALLRAQTALRSDLATAGTELASLGLRRSNNSAAMARQISELAQQLADGEGRRSLVLSAPADGTVTTILTGPGQTALPGQPLLSVLPAGALLEAQLLVPTRAVGFLQAGQSVALRYQAFPYQRFGHHVGQVLQVGRTVLQANESSLPLPIGEPVYRVTVRLPSQQVQAYGQGLPLQAGMLIDADVWIDRRRIVEWLFDPVLSVTGKV